MFAQRKALENSEKSLSEFIPYSAVIAPGVVICREGDLVATVKISGKVFEAVSNEALQRDAERQNNFLKVMASASSTDEMSLKVHRIRRVVHDELSVPDENSSSHFVRDFVRAYNREISENNLMATELYVSLVSHKATLLKRDKYKESEIREELNERLDVFGKVFDQLVSSLRATSRRFSESTKTRTESSFLTSYLFTTSCSPDNGRKSVFRSCRLTKRSGTFRFSGVLIPLNFKRH